MERKEERRRADMKKKQGKMVRRKEGRKLGRQEVKKEGRKEERKKGRTDIEGGSREGSKEPKEG